MGAHLAGFGSGIVAGALALGPIAALLGLVAGTPPSVQAGALGALVAVASCFLAGILGGGWLRGRGAEGLSALASAVGLGLVSAVAGAAGRQLWPGAAGTAQAAALTALSLGLPAALLGGAGVAIGLRLGRASIAPLLAGVVALFGLQLGLSSLVASAFDRPAEAGPALIAVSAGSFVVAGFVVAAIARRVAFAELSLLAILFQLAFYLGVATVGAPLYAGGSTPAEQVVVVAAIVPAIVAIALLTVGSSVGFLLFGTGRLEPSFAYEGPIARRYLKLDRGRDFINLTQIISVTGVALGVTALIVVMSVMSGFENDLKEKLLGAHAHIIVGKRGDDLKEYKEIEAELRKLEEVRTAAAFVLGEGMISSEAGLSGVLIKGVDVADPQAAADLAKNVTKGDLAHLLQPEKIPGAVRSASVSKAVDEILGDALTGLPTKPGSRRILPGIAIGRELAKSLRVYVGDVVNLVSPTSEELGPLGLEPKLRRFRVAAVFYSGMFEFDSKFAYIRMDQAQRFFGYYGRATGIEVRVKDLDRTPAMTDLLKRRLGGHPYTVKDYREMNRELFSALLLEKIAMFIILSSIVLVASFLIVSTLVMIVLEKGREIAILKSMGAPDASVMKIFVAQGLFVGVAGAGLGLLVGLGLCGFIEHVGIGLDSDVFYINRLPVVIDPAEIVAIVGAAIVITYLSSIYPALVAARLHPVEGLRGD